VAPNGVGQHGIGGAAMRPNSNRWWVGYRPWSWGSTPEEVAESFPYPDLVPGGKRSPTMAVTIDATPEQVWPWLVQLGWDRGGWYSWDLLDNGGRPSATEVHPEWQDIAIGDLLQFRALGRNIDAYKVGVIEPNRYLGLCGYTLEAVGLTPKSRAPRRTWKQPGDSCSRAFLIAALVW